MFNKELSFQDSAYNIKLKITPLEVKLQERLNHLLDFWSTCVEFKDDKLIADAEVHDCLEIINQMKELNTIVDQYLRNSKKEINIEPELQKSLRILDNFFRKNVSGDELEETKRGWLLVFLGYVQASLKFILEDNKIPA